MSSYQERVQALLNACVAKLPPKSPPLLTEFTRCFYAKAYAQDMERMGAARMAEVAVEAFDFMRARSPGAPKIRLLAGQQRLTVELINDDMPFLVDSLSAELSRLGFTLHETLHPIFSVQRDAKGALKALGDGAPESFIHFELSPFPPGVTEASLLSDLERVLTHVRAAVGDWPAMLAQADAALAGQTDPEARDFLEWLRDRNFIFLGYSDGKEMLGVCRLDAEAAVRGAEAAGVDITKSGRRALVHRPMPMDVIVAGARQFVGLFTSVVYYQAADEIPLVRRKIANVMARSGFDTASHDGKALKTILEFLPRDEMFQTGEDALLEVGLNLLALENRPAVRIFARADAHRRFISCMAFVPREYFSTDLRKTIMDTLSRVYGGSAEGFTTQISDAPLARLHFIIRTPSDAAPSVDLRAVESEIARTTHLWADELRSALALRYDETEAQALMQAFAGAFPQAYISRYEIGAIVYDIAKIGEALARSGLTLDLYRRRDEPERLRLKIYSPGEETALSDILPVLERFGLRVIEEQPFRVAPQGRQVWVREFALVPAEPLTHPLAEIKPLFEEAFLRVWRREAESDAFNALVPKSLLSWREVALMRAYARYARQAGFAYSQAAVEQAFSAHPALTRSVMELFAARFDPENQAPEAPLLARIEEQLAAVTSLTEDRIFRYYLALIRATLRTNYYQPERAVLSFKFRSADVPGLSKPVPFAEIFVYSPRVEGIHLRGGKVARGGLRWSDRPEDFRTEVLGLMKAQVVKNAVIVPTGSKGGFVVKHPPATREALMEEGIACYRAYLSGLLDITDNIREGAIVPPARLVRHDGDDPYLVVAADKGTASFSDIANGVARDYGFWLDDAFASGGSVGYDHKKMGITARGAWVSVTRHFREAGVDIAKESFTCVGIGDMSGDVFGNGMLLSDKVKLLAAFNHQHIFIDPLPDPAASFAERARLFALPRSGWKDYDPAKLSQGGGVYERSAKTISVSAEAAQALGLERTIFTPDELIRALLVAPVDLLWNGGIGTYVKAEDETHEQVGDRTNNALRVNGRELRCKVVGEGGNLGFTQKGRIEYARHGNNGTGGRINTDAIDNSAGVDCSDHEVNIKIAFSESVGKGRLKRDARDALLEGMTEEVAQLVLKDNVLQTQAITVAEMQGAALVEPVARLMKRLEKQGLLDRAVEFLPSAKQLAELAASGRGLTRPEIAVMLSYSKIALFTALIDTTLPDEPYFMADLLRYFPKRMKQEFAGDISRHPLRREIIATVITNSLVNRVGLTFFFDLLEETNLPPREVAAAYTLARDAFDLRKLWQGMEKLSIDVDKSTQLRMRSEINRLVDRFVLWLLRHRSLPLNIEAEMAALKPGIDAFRAALAEMHTEATRAQALALAAEFTQAGVPDELAREASALSMLAAAGDVLAVAESAKRKVAETGAAYFAVGEAFRLNALERHAARLPSATPWDRLAARALAQELAEEQRRLTAQVLSEGGMDAWRAAHADAFARYDAFIQELGAQDAPELSALLVALRAVKSL